MWVDAICIDRNNLEERNRQINLMEQIYRLNDSVYIWLGEEADGSDLAMDTLSLIVTMDGAKDAGRAEEAETKLAEFAKVCFDPAYNENWKAVIRLFSRDYWSRVWILQEVLQSSHAVLHCGTKSFPWTPLLAFLLLWQDIPMETAASRAVNYSGWPRELAKYHLPVVEREKPSLLEGLLLSRPRFATLRVDYLYGILTLVDLKGSQFKPDYSKTTMTTFRWTVLHTIQTERNLDILTACKGPKLSSPSIFPSRHRKFLRHTVLKGIRMVRLLGRVPHMVPAILNNLEAEDEPGCKESSDSNPSDDHSSVDKLNPFGVTPGEALKETQMDDLRELQEILQIPIFRAQMKPILRNVKPPDLLPTLFKDLNMIDQLERQQLPWPSWIPDWAPRFPEVFQPGIFYLLLNEPKPTFYQAAGMTEPRYDFPEDDESLLIVRGGLVDTVEHVSPHYRGSNNPPDSEIFKIAEMDWQWYCALVASTNAYGDEQARVKAFRGIQLLDRDVAGKEEDFSDEQFHDMFWKCIAAPSPEKYPPGFIRDPRFDYGDRKSDGGFTGETRVQRAVWYMRYDCRLFTTRRGYIGRGPPSLQPGDHVSVLLGGRVPFILRKDEDVEEYQLVGEACGCSLSFFFCVGCFAVCVLICVSYPSCQWHHFFESD